MNYFGIEDPGKLFPQMHNLPRPESIVALETAARWDAVPVEYQISNFNARGRNAVFDGRADEGNQLLTAFSPRSDVAESTNHQTMLMYGAQGSGKSTLLDAAEDTLRASGVAAIQLHRSAFLSKADFVEQLTASKLWRAASRLQRGRKRIMSIAGETVSQTAMLALHQQAVMWGVNDLLSHWSLVVGAARLNQTPPQTPADVLQCLDNAFAGGFVILVDEVQHWASETGNSDLSYLVNLVGDPSIRKNVGGLRSGGLILAGLADSDRTLRKLELTRIDHMRVGALEPEATLQVLHDHVQRSRLEPKVVNQVEARWCTTLANQFHPWPHHTVCAARAMVRALENMEAEWVEDGYPQPSWEQYENHLEWVRIVAARGVAKLYNERWGDAKSDSRDGLVTNIVDLSRRQANMVHVKCVEYLVSHHNAHANIHDTVTELLHSGLLEPVLDERSVMTDFLRIPIPSMAEYIRAKDTGRPDSDAVAKAAGMVPEDAVPPPAPKDVDATA